MESRAAALTQKMTPLCVRNLAKVQGGISAFDFQVPNKLVRIVTCQVCSGLIDVPAGNNNAMITCTHCGFSWFINLNK